MFWTQWQHKYKNIQIYNRKQADKTTTTITIYYKNFANNYMMSFLFPFAQYVEIRLIRFVFKNFTKNSNYKKKLVIEQLNLKIAI